MQGFVLETPGGSAPGGTGVENDWNAIAAQQRAGTFQELPPLIAAGGLRPDNVAGVVRLLHPYAVDVSSGVEESFGEKSAGKISAFLSAVENA